MPEARVKNRTSSKSGAEKLGVTNPFITELRNSRFAGSSIVRSGPSLTEKPPFQKVMVLRCSGGGSLGPPVAAGILY